MKEKTVSAKKILSRERMKQGYSLLKEVYHAGVLVAWSICGEIEIGKPIEGVTPARLAFWVKPKAGSYDAMAEDLRVGCNSKGCLAGFLVPTSTCPIPCRGSLTTVDSAAISAG
ncbi:MAG: hypothetical protein MZU95_12290 [Desulfomicrobium escambiense]|nr:hypothetical protein [Desulfomicrobium escambiense]